MSQKTYNLPSFFDADVIVEQVKLLLKKAIDAKKRSEDDFGRNVVDPFSALFEVSGFNTDHSTWKLSETARQAQKTLQNHIGTFHQNILGSAIGWEDLKTGGVVDLYCKSKKIIAEVKNKYSTISGGKLADLYYSLDRLISPKSSVYKDFTAYYVTIIPRKAERINVEFTPSDKDKGQKCPSNPCIREIDGVSFYDLVFDQKDVLFQLYSCLPSVINSLKNENLFVDPTSKNDLIAHILDQECNFFMHYFDSAFPRQ